MASSVAAPSSSAASLRVSALSSIRVESSGAPGRLERGREPLGRVPRPHGDDEQHGCVGRPAQQRADQLEGGRVAPVHVVQHEYERACRSQAFEQLADGAVGAVALV